MFVDVKSRRLVSKSPSMTNSREEPVKMTPMAASLKQRRLDRMRYRIVIANGYVVPQEDYARKSLQALEFSQVLQNRLLVEQRESRKALEKMADCLEKLTVLATNAAKT